MADKMKTKILTPHGTFFQKSLQRLTIAKDFFKQNLPVEIQQAIDWSTLSISSEMLYVRHEVIRRSCFKAKPPMLLGESRVMNKELARQSNEV